MVSSVSRWWWPGLSRPPTFRKSQSVGWVERSETHRRATRHAKADDGFRFAQPILRALVCLLAIVPFAAHAQTIEEKAQTCAACHGDNGIPADKSWPVIWGQHQGYLYLQLRDFKSGARKSDIMGPAVQDLSRDDMLAIALYFSQKPWPDLRQPRAGGAIA